jgi:DNA polymerase III sliding clamp (beta) subunit (PCNA family)
MMKFALSRSVALTVLGQALKTCDTKAKGEADSEFLITVGNGAKPNLVVTSLNAVAEQTVELELISISDDNQASFSVSGQAMVEFLRQFPDEEVSCAYHADRGLFVMGSTVRKTQFAFPTGHPDDFIPFKFQPAKGVSPVAASGDALANALRLTAFAASTNYEHAPKTAVKVCLNGSSLVAQAADDARVSIASMEVEDVGANALEFLLPRVTAEILSTLLNEIDTVTIHPGEKHIRFEWAGSCLTSALENGIGKPFPNLSRFFSGDEIARYKVSRGDLIRSVKLASIVAKDSYLTIKGSADGLTIITSDQMRGAGHDTVTVQEATGDGETMVSFKNFTKAIEMADSPWIAVSFRTLPKNYTALIVEDGGYQHLMIPCDPPKAPADTTDGDS